MTLFDGAGPVPITLEAQVAEAEDELRMREYVYPKRVKDGKMDARKASMKTAAMRAIIRTLRGILESGETPPETTRFKPGVLVELQTQAARGDVLKRHVKELLDAADASDDPIPQRFVEAITVLRNAMKSMVDR